MEQIIKGSLEAALAQSEINIVPDFQAKKQRSGSQWLFCQVAEVGGKTIEFAWFGDWRKGLTREWHGSEVALTEDQEKQFKSFLKQNKKAYQEMKETLQLEMAQAAGKFLHEECTERAQPNAYFQRKKIPELLGTLVHVNAHGSHVAVIPMRDVDGLIWNYQRIYPEKLSHGDKFFATDARIEGCFFTLGELNDTTQTIYIAEGFATAASIYLAFNQAQCVVAGLNAGNLAPVAKALRGKYPDARILLCADNDAFTVVGGQPHNTGLEAARSAAADCNGEVVYPRFKGENPEKLTDFNDLHCAYGLDAVHEQIQHPERFKPEGEITPILCRKDKKPSEEAIASVMLKHLGERIIREGKDLFLYLGTHWERALPEDISKLRNLIMATAPGKLRAGDVSSALYTLMDKLPFVPRTMSMYQPSPAMANFRNGTVHFTRQPDQTYTAELMPHNPLNFVTSVLPFDWDPTNTEVNREFEEMLERIWEPKRNPDDTEKQFMEKQQDMRSKIDHYAENLGSMFCGLFPHITIYKGKSGSGKSTLLKLARRLVDPKNVCSVDPCDFEGFQMSSMPGKLVNIVLELDIQGKMKDKHVKNIIDRTEFRISRKNIEDIYAFIPAIHLWAGNKLPKSLEGDTGSLDRRITIIATDEFRAKGKYDLDYETSVWNSGSQGIINFAVKGLLRLLANQGHYTRPRSSRDEMKDWGLQSDAVGMFVEEIRQGEGGTDDKHRQLLAQPGLKIERKEAWEAFLKWSKEQFSGRKCPEIPGKLRFYNALEAKEFPKMKSDGVWMFSGIGWAMAKDAKH